MKRDWGIDRMIADIQREMEYTKSWVGKDRLDERVLDAMRRVPRDRFVPKNMRGCAFENGPLSIGHGQTISQPYIVALMTDLLNPKPDHKVLEIGTGSGYQAAVLSQVVKQVFSVEIIPELAYSAVHKFDELGYDNIQVKTGDGYNGWDEHAPFDGIIITAAAPHIPQPLVDQLKPGAKLVLPLGAPYGHQELIVVDKQFDGTIDAREVLAVAFVPLTGKHEQDAETVLTKN
jgi:protein-L-isoaspartate(D-aspartate) O-methyltransferase